MRLYIRIFMVFAAILLLSNCAIAQQITVMVTGTVTYSDIPPGLPSLPTDIMTGSFVYDTLTADTDPSDQHGLYALQSLTMTLGDYTVTHDTAAVTHPLFEVQTSPLSYLAYTDDGKLTAQSQTFTGIQVELMDLCDSSTAANDAFPLAFPDPQSFYDVRNEFSVTYSDVMVSLTIEGVVDTIVIPEPATICLFALTPIFLRKKR